MRKSCVHEICASNDDFYEKNARSGIYRAKIDLNSGYECISIHYKLDKSICYIYCCCLRNKVCFEYIETSNAKMIRHQSISGSEFNAKKDAVDFDAKNK